MRQRSSALAAALVAALVLTTSPAMADDTAPRADGADGISVVGALAGLGLRVADGVSQQVAQAVSVAASNPCSGTGSTLRKTSNGSLTVLLLGSDYRTARGPSARTP